MFNRSAFAAIPLLVSVAYADEGYYRPWQLPHDRVPENLSNAVEAALKLRTDDSTCSAALISNDGYVLTALHCLSSCGPGSPVVETRLSSGARVWAASGKRQPGTRCQGAELVGIRGARDPEIAYLGSGIAFRPKGKVLHQLSMKQLTEMAAHSGDYAILKFELRKPRRCAPFTSRPAAPGDPLWAIGMPGVTQRAYRHGSNGHSEYVSYGDAADITRLFGNPRAQSAFETVYPADRWMLSDLDIYDGNSGGMTINSRGEIVGISSWTKTPAEVDSMQVYDERMQAFHFRAEAVLEDLRRDLGEARTREITHCDNSGLPEARLPRPWWKWILGR